MKRNIYFIATLILFHAGCNSNVDAPAVYDYSIEQRMDCFCTNSGAWINIYVSSDTVSYAERIPDGSQLTYDEFKYYKSIKGLFDFIAGTDTSKYILNYRFDYGNDYPSYIYTNLKPIVINDTTIVTVADADVAYTTRNYVKID